MKKFVLIPLLAIVGFVAWSIYNNLKNGDEALHEISGTIECEEVSLGSIEGGRVAEVFVKEGAALKTGDHILRIENSALEKSVFEARAAAEAARAGADLLNNGYDRDEIAATRAAMGALEKQYSLLEEGTRKEQIAAAKAEVAAAEAAVENTTKIYERQNHLYEVGAAPRQAADNAQLARRSAEERLAGAKAMYDMAVVGPREDEKKAAAKKLEEGRARLRRLERGPRPEEKAQAQAAFEQAQARVATLEARLDELTVKAPSDCVVDVLDLYPGDLVGPGEEIARVVLGERLWVDVFVPEDRIGMVKQGEKVKLKVDSFPGEKFEGTVSRVAKQAEFTPRNVQTPEGRATQVFRVRIDITDPQKRLRAGMPAVVDMPAVFSKK